jgi:WD40 repeat protein
MAFDPTGQHVAVSTDSSVLLVPFEGGPVRQMPVSLPGYGRFFMVFDFSPDGRFLACAFGISAPEEMVIRVWDLQTDQVRVLGPVPGDTSLLSFDDNRRLRWVGRAGSTPGGTGGERIFDLVDGSIEIVATEGAVRDRETSSDGAAVVELQWASKAKDVKDVLLTWKSLEDGVSRPISTHQNPWKIGLHPSDQWIVSAGQDSIVRVGPLSGEEPQLLFGHKGLIREVAVSPDGRWIASAGDDRTVRLWPFPDMATPPLHTLPIDELIAELHSRTNVRVVEDPETSTGWKLDCAPFTGWNEIPGWP